MILNNISDQPKFYTLSKITISSYHAFRHDFYFFSFVYKTFLMLILLKSLLFLIFGYPTVFMDLFVLFSEWIQNILKPSKKLILQIKRLIFFSTNAKLTCLWTLFFLFLKPWWKIRITEESRKGVEVGKWVITRRWVLRGSSVWSFHSFRRVFSHCCVGKLHNLIRLWWVW